jgi:aspartate aminotransferase
VSAALPGSTVSRKNQALQDLTAPVVSFLTGSTWARRKGEPGVADFVVGNPQEMPLPGFVDALREQIEPRANDWFAYRMNDPAACAVVASSLSERQGGAPFDPDDIMMTPGAFAGLSVALKTVIDPGDEVIFVSPPWFFYETLIAAEGGVPVRVRVRPPRFDLDVTEIAAAISERTRAIVINSPNNPTGRIYPAATLRALAAVLERASAQHGRRIYLLSDEAYNRVVFDGQQFVSPTRSYPWSLLIYTYGKTLLTPGQRLGYIALPPEMPSGDREMLRGALTLSQIVTGYAFPNALLQHALPDLEPLSIDIAALERKRDRMVGALREMGYEVGVPEGTFYLLPRAPVADDLVFVEELAARDVFVLPGAAVELPGYFRVSLTATDEMIEQALPAFAALSRPPRSRAELASV